MHEFSAKLHRTWVQLLIDDGHKEVAAIAVEAELDLLYYGYDPHGFAISVPTSWYGIVKTSDHLKKIMEEALIAVADGNITGNNDDDVDVEKMGIVYRVKLVEVEDGWENIVRSLIANAKDTNQGVITEKVFVRNGKQPYMYNEMKFGSQSEMRIAQELENRKVLFFPLPFAVRAETGVHYKDHREPDFLICDNGVWGILEVSYHRDRYEQDAEKDIWFQKSGVLCVRHYTSERCQQNPKNVVTEFLDILAKHKR